MLLPASAWTRTLAEIQARGLVSMCANPDALPYASNRSDTAGFQIDIGRALASALCPAHGPSLDTRGPGRL
jgi:polar amino acid transport system substrate-binding protein